MITFYQCLQEHLKIPGAYPFTPKDIHKLSNYCKFVYDKKDNLPVTYTDSIEGDKTYQVRNYPDSFKKTIMGILWRIGKIKKEKVLHQEQLQGIIEAHLPKVDKVRKRVPVKRAAYSVKPSKVLN